MFSGGVGMLLFSITVVGSQEIIFNAK